MTTSTLDDAIENAARLLRIKENAYVRTYGGVAGVAIELAAAWTDLARVIAKGDN